MNIRRKLLIVRLFICVGGNEDIIKIPQAIQSTGAIGQSSESRYHLCNGRSVGAIESASRFNCAAKITALTRSRNHFKGDGIIIATTDLIDMLK